MVKNVWRILVMVSEAFLLLMMRVRDLESERVFSERVNGV